MMSITLTLYDTSSRGKQMESGAGRRHDRYSVSILGFILENWKGEKGA